jgi:hypothetical protein
MRTQNSTEIPLRHLQCDYFGSFHLSADLQSIGEAQVMAAVIVLSNLAEVDELHRL